MKELIGVVKILWLSLCTLVVVCNLSTFVEYAILARRYVWVLMYGTGGL